MATTSFREYQPGGSPYAKRISAEEWELYRPYLSNLHKQRVSRRKMLEKLAGHGFEPSMGQLVSKMKQWDLMILSEHNSGSGARSQPSTAKYESLQPLVQLDLPNVGKRTSRDDAWTDSNCKASPCQSSLSMKDPESSNTVDLGPRNVPHVDKDVQRHLKSNVETSDNIGLRTDRYATPSRASNTTESLPSTAYIELCSRTSLRKLREIVTVTSSGALSTTDTKIHRRQSDIGRSIDEQMQEPCSADATQPLRSFNFESLKSRVFSVPPIRSFQRTDNDEADSKPLDTPSYLTPDQKDRVAERLELNYLGFWTSLNPTKCCCLEFFDSYYPGGFAGRVYWMLLRAFPQPSSIGRAMCLIHIWYARTAFEREVWDTEYHKMLRDSTEHYRQLNQRANIVNERNEVGLLNTFVRQSEAGFATFYSRSTSMASGMGRARTASSQDTADFIWGSLSQVRMEYKVREIIHSLIVSLRGEPKVLADHALLLWYKGQETKCREIKGQETKDQETSATPHSLRQPPPSNEIVELASEAMSRLNYRILLPLDAQYHHELFTLVNTLFILQELEDYIQPLFLDLNRDYSQSFEELYAQSFTQNLKGGRWETASISKLVSPNCPTPTIESLEVSERLDKFLSTIWACDVFPQTHRPSYRNLHLGKCSQGHIWELLERKVTDFDKKTPPPSQANNIDSSALKRWSNQGSTLSVQTTSSNNSFNRFQKYAFQLKSGDFHASKVSLESRWSGHMSLDSWTFEDIMDIEKGSASRSKLAKMVH